MLYEIVESGSRGKIVVATKDILPGELVLREDALLHFSSDFLARYEGENSHMMSLTLACFSKYKKVLTQAQRQKFAALFGPTTGTYAEGMRKVGRIMFCDEYDNEEYRQLTDAEVEEFVKVANVMRLNMFGADYCGYSVFGEVTRFAHSCTPNCTNELKDQACTCLALRHIRKGEELTLSYNNPRDQEPTHIRRQKYLENKEFTCHCPRCDAPGDDTRQFDCFNPACKGVMMVCQPINNEELANSDMSYTGVEYVEPHLLPCTECHRAAPVEYQAKMLELETDLPALGVEFQVTMDKLRSDNSYQMFGQLLAEIEGTRFPRRNLLSLPLLRIILHIRRNFLITPALTSNAVQTQARRADVQRAAEEYIRVQESVFPWPTVGTVGVLKDVCNWCILEWTALRLPPIYSPQQAKELLQKTMRKKLLWVGRADGQRDKELDEGLLVVLSDLPSLQSSEVCAFCDESPVRAALTLSRCGKCKQVCYCSAGCQKAHWKLHKKTCTAP